MEWKELVARMQELAGASHEDAVLALSASISSLVEALSTDEADALLRELPDPLRPLVRGHAMAVPLGRDALLEHVAVRESLEVGFATEHAECAFQALAERLSPELRTRLQRHLPRLAAFFELKDMPDEPQVGPVHGATLATGRPGSGHPVSEARPESAQSQSVVRSAEPHGDTKLSSARGVAEDREGRTIATAKR